MSQTSTERLRDYLAQLPPQSQALLMREFERAIERGEETAVANFVLEQLRKIVRGADDDEARPRTDDPARLLFRPLEPFLVEGNRRCARARFAAPRCCRSGSGWPARGRRTWPRAIRGGAVPRSGERHVARDRGRRAEIPARRGRGDLQAIAGTGDDDRRALSRDRSAGCRSRICRRSAAMLQAREALETLSSRLPSYMRVFNDAQIASVTAALNVPSLQTPQMLPFALSLVMQRLAAPWQIIRLAITHGGFRRRNARRLDALRHRRDDRACTICIASRPALRADIRRGRFDEVAEHLKTLHDGVRGLRTELDLRNDSAWGRQLASIRADISNALQSEIDSVPGRVRRLLRQRTDKDIAAGAGSIRAEVEETAALIEFVAVCRTYASELAINEVTMRTYSDLQHYVEQSTEALVQSLRGSEGKARAYRQAQVAAAIRFCDVLFGADYASLMSRAAENAVTGERKSSRADNPHAMIRPSPGGKIPASKSHFSEIFQFLMPISAN